MGTQEENQTPETSKGEGNAFTNWIRRHPVWGIVIAVLTGLVLGAGAAASDTSELDSARAEIAALERQLDRETAALADAEEHAEELEDESARVASRAARLEQKAGKLRQRERQVTAAERREAQNSIDDGIWQVGVDFEAGTYRAEGGPLCYWALLDSADTWDIVNNGGFSANQTLTIDSAWFETKGCGTWKKID